MKNEKIITKNAAYQKIESLKLNKTKRHQEKCFFVEGVRNINEAIKNNWEILSFIYSFEKPLSPWGKNLVDNIKTEINYEFSDSLMKEISSKEETSELLIIVKMKDNNIKGDALSSNPVIALFDRPSKKANLGTILRSCDALGVELLIITGHSVDIYDPDVISSTMGSFFKTPFIRLDENNEIDNFVKDLKSKYNNLKVVGTTSHSKEDIYSIDMKTPLLFLIGNETDGLNKHLLELSDVLATIPMNENSSASSLNVSCAASIMFYEALRQRSK